jgi:hypothetical protein
MAEGAVEFEFESRNFLKHKHDPNGCDVIVCWFPQLAGMPAEYSCGGVEQDHEGDAVSFVANRSGRELRDKMRIRFAWW